MAKRRMFAKSIVDSDLFLDMPLSSQVLYFHLSMRADDDGFVDNPRSVQRVIGASNDDFKMLVAKQFVIPFESGIIVIRHWKIHNYIQKDRYTPTTHKEEQTQLTLNHGVYEPLDTECIQDVSNMETKCLPRLGKVRLGKVRESSYVEKKFPDDAEEVILTQYLIQKMLQNNDKVRIPKTEKQKNDWIIELERTHRIDGYPYDQIKGVIEWCQNDAFWKGNILSTKKLREKMPTLILQMQRLSANGSGNGGKSQYRKTVDTLDRLYQEAIADEPG